jgi:hypothetical protein
VGPFQTGDRVSRGIVFQQNFDGIDYFGVLFFGPWASAARFADPGERHMLV